MLILNFTKKLKSRRIHDVLQKMAAAVVVFGLTFFCAFLLKAGSVPTNMAIMRMDGSALYERPKTSGDRKSDSGNTDTQMRDHRILHFSDDRERIKDKNGHDHSKKSQKRHFSNVSVSPNRNADYRNTSEIPIQRLPQAIIIGVKKSGTRALLEFLRIHPDVEGTGPEPHFFDRNYERGLDWYRSLMPKTYEGQITVEKTPSYFITKEAPKRIFKMNPEIKLILVVRDPVTRAISDYCQAASKRPVSVFEDMALLNERKGLVNASWNAIKLGVYAKHIQKWLKTFRRDQIHLVDGEALITGPAKELDKVEHFLGLPKYINNSHFHLNAFKGTFPCLIRRGKKHCLDERTKGRDHPNVRENVLQNLRDYYRPFNAKFYEIVGQNFGWSA